MVPSASQEVRISLAAIALHCLSRAFGTVGSRRIKLKPQRRAFIDQCDVAERDGCRRHVVATEASDYLRAAIEIRGVKHQ
jgi:hypothetical protein